MKRFGKFGLWLAVLLLVLSGISTATYHTGLPGSGIGTGVFSYWFRAHFDIDLDYDEFESSTVGSITIEGSAPPRLMAWGHASPKYRAVEIDWYLSQKSEGKAAVDLNASLITGPRNSVPLDAQNLATLFEITDPVEQDDLLFANLLEFLETAKEGKLPRPNHHGYLLPLPFPGRMKHFATGVSLRPVELLWVISWSTFGFVVMVNHNRIWKRLINKASTHLSS